MSGPYRFHGEEGAGVFYLYSSTQEDINRVYPTIITFLRVTATGYSDNTGSGAVEQIIAHTDLAGFVREGATHAETAGEDAALVGFNNGAGRFSQGALYVYAYDSNGTLLAHPHLQNSIGTCLNGRQDPYGMENIRALRDTAKSGGGFIAFIWPNPAQEKRDELKIGYVVDDTWWVGPGVYLSEITEENASPPPRNPGKPF